MADPTELTPEQARQGVEACLKNAHRLRALALLVAETDEAMGTFIAMVRVEELAKASMLQSVADGEIPSDWDTFRKRLNGHPGKWAEFKLQTMNEVIGWTRERREQEMRESARKDAKTRELTLYVDFRDDGWWSPLDGDWSKQTQHSVWLGDALAIKRWGHPRRG